MHFKKIASKGRNPNKIWIDQGSKFYNNSFKDLLKINNIEMYSTCNERKSVVAEGFIRTLKNKMFKHMTATLKIFFFNVLDDIVNKYNNTQFIEPLKRNPLTSELLLMLNTMKIQVKKILNSKLVIMLEFQKIKTFLLKDTIRVGQKKFLLLVKLKI